MLVVAELLSTMGTEMTLLAVPWFVLTTSGSPTKMGVALAVALLPVGLFAIPSGGIIARLGALRTMRVADLARAPLIALIPLLHEAGALSFALLLVLMFASGAFAAPHFSAQRTVLPEIFGEDERLVGQANSVVEGATRLAMLAGPAVGGFLIAAIGATAVLWLDAASYLISFLLLGVLPRRRSTTTVAGGALLGGVTHLLRDRLLKRLSVASALYGFLIPGMLAALPVLAYTRYGKSPEIAGWLYATWGAGSVIGSVAAYRLASRAKPLGLVAAAAVGRALPLWLLALHLPLAGMAGAVFISGVFVPLLNAPALTVITLHTPPQLRAQVVTTLIAANMLAGPLGYLCAGPAIEQLGVEPVFLVEAFLATACAALLIHVSRGSFVPALRLNAEGGAA